MSTKYRSILQRRLRDVTILKLLEAGKNGGSILSHAHAVEGDVSLENMLAFMDVLHSQRPYKRR
jgi:hypothetical protein